MEAEIARIIRRARAVSLPTVSGTGVSAESCRKQPYNDVTKQNVWVCTLSLFVLILINEAAHLA